MFGRDSLPVRESLASKCDSLQHARAAVGSVSRFSMLPEAVPPRDHRTPRGGTPRGEDSVPHMTPLQVAKQRLQWSKTLHERLGVDCYYCEDYHVVANVGRLVCAVETKDQRRVRLLRESYEADPTSEAWARGLEAGDAVVAATKQGWWYATMGRGVEDSETVWVQDDAVWVVRDLHSTPASRSFRTLGRRRQGDTTIEVFTGRRTVWMEASWLMPVPELMKLHVLATNSGGKKEELTLPGMRLSNSVAHVKRQLELLTSKPPDGQRLSLSAANWGSEVAGPCPDLEVEDWTLARYCEEAGVSPSQDEYGRSVLYLDLAATSDPAEVSMRRQERQRHRDAQRQRQQRALMMRGRAHMLMLIVGAILQQAGLWTFQAELMLASCIVGTAWVLFSMVWRWWTDVVPRSDNLKHFHGVFYFYLVLYGTGYQYLLNGCPAAMLSTTLVRVCPANDRRVFDKALAIVPCYVDTENRTITSLQANNHSATSCPQEREMWVRSADVGPAEQVIDSPTWEARVLSVDHDLTHHQCHPDEDVHETVFTTAVLAPSFAALAFLVMAVAVGFNPSPWGVVPRGEWFRLRKEFEADHLQVERASRLQEERASRAKSLADQLSTRVRDARADAATWLRHGRALDPAQAQTFRRQKPWRWLCIAGIYTAAALHLACVLSLYGDVAQWGWFGAACLALLSGFCYDRYLQHSGAWRAPRLLSSEERQATLYWRSNDGDVHAGPTSRAMWLSGAARYCIVSLLTSLLISWACYPTGFTPVAIYTNETRRCHGPGQNHTYSNLSNLSSSRWRGVDSSCTPTWWERQYDNYAAMTYDTGWDRVGYYGCRHHQSNDTAICYNIHLTKRIRWFPGPSASKYTLSTLYADDDMEAALATHYKETCAHFVSRVACASTCGCTRSIGPNATDFTVNQTVLCHSNHNFRPRCTSEIVCCSSCYNYSADFPVRSRQLYCGPMTQALPEFDDPSNIEVLPRTTAALSAEWRPSNQLRAPIETRWGPTLGSCYTHAAVMYSFVALVMSWGIYSLLPPSKGRWLCQLLLPPVDDDDGDAALFHEATWFQLLFHEEQEIQRELQAAATRAQDGHSHCYM